MITRDALQQAVPGSLSYTFNVKNFNNDFLKFNKPRKIDENYWDSNRAGLVEMNQGMFGGFF